MAGVGTGLTARSAISGGADVVIASHSAPIRLAGLPSIAGLMPFANANALVREIGPAIVRAAGGPPVLATACAADRATSQPALLAELRGLGFCGVLAAPTATLIDALASGRNSEELRGPLDAERCVGMTRAGRKPGSPRTGVRHRVRGAAQPGLARAGLSATGSSIRRPRN